MQGAKRRARRTHRAEGGTRVLRQVHTNFCSAEGRLRVPREVHTSLCEAEGRLGELRKASHKYLPKKFWPEAQDGTGE